MKMYLRFFGYLFIAMFFAINGSAFAQVSVLSGGPLPNATYSTLQQAFDSINVGKHIGDINITITGNIVETASATLNASGVGLANYNSVNIAPSGGPWTIQGDISTSLISLDYADNVTIDGGITKNLILKNNSTLTPSAVIWIKGAFF